MAKMIFARQIDTGKIVGIDDVESGLKCNCVCPHCGDILEARKGKIRVHHFAHSGKGETAFCSETALHLAAKEILKEERKILLPRLKIDDDIYHSCFEIMPDGYEFIYDTVEVEKSIFVDNELIRPDLIVSKGNAVLAVEILVSHAVDEEKKEKIKRARLTTIEIELNADEIINKETLRNILVSKTSNKKWIFSKQRNYFAEKIPQICKKFIVKNKIVRDCPINIWQGRKLGASVGQCNGCKYGYGVSLEHVWCLGEKRIAKIDDLKLNVDKLQEHIKNKRWKKWKMIKKFF